MEKSTATRSELIFTSKSAKRDEPSNQCQKIRIRTKIKTESKDEQALKNDDSED
jgi:hypothetical protein